MIVVAERRVFCFKQRTECVQTISSQILSDSHLYHLTDKMQTYNLK